MKVALVFCMALFLSWSSAAHIDRADVLRVYKEYESQSHRCHSVKKRIEGWVKMYDGLCSQKKSFGEQKYIKWQNEWRHYAVEWESLCREHIKKDYPRIYKDYFSSLDQIIGPSGQNFHAAFEKKRKGKVHEEQKAFKAAQVQRLRAAGLRHLTDMNITDLIEGNPIEDMWRARFQASGSYLSHSTVEFSREFQKRRHCGLKSEDGRVRAAYGQYMVREICSDKRWTPLRECEQKRDKAKQKYQVYLEGYGKSNPLNPDELGISSKDDDAGATPSSGSASAK